MNNQECCNQNCNQGRDCPLRKIEPVAWMEKVKGGTIYFGYKNPRSIPLYTHPVKELTDEEIEEVAVINLGHSMGLLNWMGFARAILRKAQEK